MLISFSFVRLNFPPGAPPGEGEREEELFLSSSSYSLSLSLRNKGYTYSVFLGIFPELESGSVGIVEFLTGL